MLRSKLSKICWPVMLAAVLMSTAVVVADTNKAKDPEAPIEKLEFQGADIRSVIYFLADYGNVNVVVAPNVQGTVTISVRGVSWKQGLEIIGKTYDLAIVYEESGYIRVLPAKEYRSEVTEIEKYKLNKQQLSPLETRIVKIGNSTATDVSRAVEGLLTQRGKVSPDPRTNSVIIREVPENMEMLLKFIAELDSPPRQIRISAKLLEVNSSYMLEHGAKLGFTTSGTISNGATAVNNVGTSDGVTDLVTDPFGTYSVSFINSNWTLDGLISALVTDGKGRILAHPEITTIENKEARIQMGQKIPIKQFDASGNVTTVFEEVGTILRVTPHITADNRILMELWPERSFAEIGANGVIISTNNAKTNVIVENNQTAVIGGLTTEDEVESEVGIPLFKEIPLLGNLFKYKRKSRLSRDLIILVTPTIVGGPLADAG